MKQVITFILLLASFAPLCAQDTTAVPSRAINAFLAAAGWNLKKMMLQLKKEALSIFNFFIWSLNPKKPKVVC